MKILLILLFPSLLFAFGGTDVEKWIDKIISPVSTTESYIKYSTSINGWVGSHDGTIEFKLGDGAGGGGGEFNYLLEGNAETFNPWLPYSPYWTESQKFVPSISGGSKFGKSMNRSGEYLLVGAPDANGTGTLQGEAFIYKQSSDGLTWDFLQKLVASPIEDNSKFGYSLAIDGNKAVVGAYLYPDAGNPSGALFTFKLVNNVWVFKSLIRSSDLASGDKFGWAVDLNGNNLIVSALRSGSMGIGSVYFFKTADDGETWVEETKFDGIVGYNYGTSVSIYENKAIVGASNGYGTVNGGSVYPYTTSDNGDNWLDRTGFAASDEATGAKFGSVVKLDGNTLVVGAQSDSEYYSLAGAVYTYKTSDNGVTYDTEQKIQPSDASNFSLFGYSVDVKDNELVIGAQAADGAGGTGKAYVYTRDAGNWYERSIFVGSGTVDDDKFGESVAIENSVISVGSINHSATGSGFNFAMSHNFSVVKNTTNPLFETSDFNFISNGNHLVGDYFYYPFTLDSGDIGKRLFSVIEGIKNYVTDSASIQLYSVFDSQYIGEPIKIKDSLGIFEDESVFTINNASSTDYEFRIISDVVGSFDFNADNFRVQRNPVSKTSFIDGGEKNYLFYGDAETINPWVSSKSIKERQKVIGPAFDGDEFGKSVAIDGDIKVVGAPYRDISGTDRGVVYIFRTYDDGETWTSMHALSNPDANTTGADNDRFGLHVAVSGNIIVVSSQYIDEAGNIDSGAAYVYKTNEKIYWGFKQKLTYPPSVANTNYGASIAIDGNFIAVSATGVGIGLNLVSVWETSDAGDTWVYGQTIVNPLSNNTDKFGYSLSLHENLLVVGALAVAGGGQNRGAAYVYKNTTTWQLKQTLTASDTANLDLFGTSVSVNEDLIVVGADHKGIGTEFHGAAYVYKTLDSGDTWTEKQKLLASDILDDARFGCSVAIDEDLIIIGAHRDGAASSFQGAAYVYQTLNNGDTWIEKQKLLASDTQGGDFFGDSVAIDEDLIVIGAPNEDGAGAGRGAAYVFKYTENLFVEKNLTNPLYDKADWKVYSNGYQQVDDYLYYPFSIQSGDTASMLSLLVEKIKASASYDTDDASFKVWDVANEKYLSGNSTIWASTIGTRHDAGFQTDATGLDYELRIVSNVATAWEFSSDNYKMQRQGAQKGVPSTNWKDFVPVFANDDGMNLAVNRAIWRQAGPNLQIDLKISANGAGTSGNNFVMYFPTGTTNVNPSAATSYGSGTFYDTTAAAFDPAYFWIAASDMLGFKTKDLSFIRGAEVQNGDSFTLFAEIPIAGWQSEAAMSSTRLNRDIHSEYYTNGAQTLATTDKIPFALKIKDSTSAWDGDEFTVQEDGRFCYDGAAFFIGNAARTIYAYKDSTSLGTASDYILSNDWVKFSGCHWFKKGEVLSFKEGITAGLLNNTIYHRLTIWKANSGTEKLFEDAQVTAIYETAVGNVIVHNVWSNLNFLTKIKDTHNAVTTGTGAWRFDPPMDGTYRITVITRWQGYTGWHMGEFQFLYMTRNSYNSIDTVLCSYTFPTSDAAAIPLSAPTMGNSVEVELTKNDYISIGIFQNSGSNLALYNNADYNRVSIVRIK